MGRGPGAATGGCGVATGSGVALAVGPAAAPSRLGLWCRGTARSRCGGRRNRKGRRRPATCRWGTRGRRESRGGRASGVTSPRRGTARSRGVSGSGAATRSRGCCRPRVGATARGGTGARRSAAHRPGGSRRVWSAPAIPYAAPGARLGRGGGARRPAVAVGRVVRGTGGTAIRGRSGGGGAIAGATCAHAIRAAARGA